MAPDIDSEERDDVIAFRNGSGRRRFLLGVGATLATFTLAGCADDDDPAPDDDPDPDDDDDADDDPDLDEWFEDTPNYDDVEDFTGEEEVHVDNGHVDEYGQYVFDPAAIRVDAGTTVVWEWIDDDAHSVTERNDAFDSGIEDGEGTTFEHTFEETGTYLYYCSPHRAMGQKGAVIVE